MDFSLYGDLDHPLATATGWDLFSAGVKYRACMDRLAGGALTQQLLAWWLANVTFKHQAIGDADKWPTLNPGEGETEQFNPPGPENPYRDGTTSRGNVSGFDADDLAAALAAQRVVRGGKGFGTVDLALILALAEREGYRANAARDRQAVPELIGGPAHAKFLGVAASDANVGPEYLNWSNFREVFARNSFLIWPFGLDHMIFPDPLSAIKPSQLRYLQSTSQTFQQQLENFTLPADPDHALLPRDFLPSEDVDRFIRDRVDTRRAAAGNFDVVRLSRELQWVGLAIQAALFQYRHFQLHDPTAHGYEAVPEFTSPVLPDPGVDANSAERAEYVAYYALLYMAFNLTRETFNRWVVAARNFLTSHPGEPETIPSLILFRKDTDPPPLSWSGRRNAAHRGNVARFALALDAYSRLEPDPAGGDDHDPGVRGTARNWRGVP
jgi:hypothetical protein